MGWSHETPRTSCIADERSWNKFKHASTYDSDIKLLGIYLPPKN